MNTTHVRTGLVRYTGKETSPGLSHRSTALRANPGSDHQIPVPLPHPDEPQTPVDLNCIIHLVSRAYGVCETALRSPNRCDAQIAEARQVAMYLGHVGFGCSFTQIGEMIGRDRTTAAHACQKVEDKRDFSDFDMALDYLEAVLHLRAHDPCEGDPLPASEEAGL